MKGIHNIGNSCYLNSALQLLFNSDDFYKLTYKSNDLYKEAREYREGTNVYNPRNIKSLIDSRTNLFKGSSQQDSSEFITFLFDIVSTFNNNKLYEKFGIQTDINIKCKLVKCLHESSHIENDLMLVLPLTDNLSDSYRMYKSSERLDNDNAYDCEKCKMKTIARKRIEIVKWPTNLIIILKRFDGMMRKDNNKISIPIDWRHGYTLKGGIVHIGSFNGGHYIYYGYNKSTHEWFIANDSNISIINKEKLNELVPNSYILYYTKE